MQRRAFTVLELLLVFGMLSVVAGIVTPTYRDYRIRSDLHNAANQVSQALSRARLLSQTGIAERQWGVSLPHATMFAGSSFDDRIATYDEHIFLPTGIALSGLEEVTFSQLEGVPSVTGSIILTSLRKEQVEVSVLIERQGITVSMDDTLTICHCEASPPHTLRIPDAAWPAHREHGDTLGACPLSDASAACNTAKK